MLAVTTFSLSIMASRIAGVASSATPRAAPVVAGDRVTQIVLATFVGAFLYALVAIIALNTGVYGGSGRLVLFITTILVVVIVVASLLSWIGRLSRLGRIDDTLDQLEARSIDALEARLAAPWLSAHPLEAAPPDHAVPVQATEIGYIQHIDVARMNRIAKEAGFLVYLGVLPGSFLYPGQPFACVEKVAGQHELPEDIDATLADCMSIGTSRSFDQDPAFGLITMMEIALRALSPAVNDPDTAIAVLGRLLRVLAKWSEPAEPEVIYDRLWVPSLTARSVLCDLFEPISRDGAGNFDVQVRIQKTLCALAAHAPGVFSEPAAELSQIALERSQRAVDDESLKAVIRRIAAPLHGDM